MKLKSDLERSYSIQPLDYVCTNDQTNKSKGHLRARNLLKEIFPTEWILEEVPLKIYKSTLYADFLLPNSKIIVEVQGIQHDQFIEFFHKTRANFRESQKRDLLKYTWCDINEFRLVQLPYNETDDIWMELINGN